MGMLDVALAVTRTGEVTVLPASGCEIVTAAGSVEILEVEALRDEVKVIVSGDIMLLQGGTKPVRVRQRYWFDPGGSISRIRAACQFNQGCGRSRWTTELKGVMQLDKLNDDNALLLVKNGTAHDLKTVPLP